MKLVKAFSVLFICAALAPSLCRPAQMMSPFEEKLRYERALEQKGDEILVKVLGPNQARVSVEATLKIEENLDPNRAQAPQSQFAWLNAAQKNEKMKELLPGFTAAVTLPAMNEDEARSYSYNVAKLSVNIIAGVELTQDKITNISDLVERVLGLDMKRGDTIDLVKTQFAPIWKAIWYSPEYMGLFIRYGMVALVIIISFMIIGLGIMRMAGAMSDVARAQDVSIGFGGEGGGGGPGGTLAVTGQEGEAQEKKDEIKEVVAEEAERLVFNVKREQIPLLTGMLQKEDPENISLVVYHLPDEIRGELLANLGKELASQVILHLAKVRFIDRDVITEIKEELERRLDSAVGGMDKAVKMIAPMPYSGKKDMLKQFAMHDPALAAEIRSVFIFDEDLLSLSEKDMGIVSTSIQVMQWAEVFPALPHELQEKIKKQLSAKSLQMIEQTMKYSVTNPRKQDEAMDKFMEVIAGLVKDGRIAKPAADSGLIALDKAGAAPSAPSEPPPAPGAFAPPPVKPAATAGKGGDSRGVV
ncbi:MAG: FliG C-terminal domain-containing protein [Elusimicrobiota bacterium]